MATSTAYIPTTYNTGIVRGDTFEEEFSFTTGGEPVVLAGAVVRIQIRTRGGEVVGSYENGAGVVVGESSFIWSIEGSETSEWVGGSYQFDIEITIGGTVRTYAAGAFDVIKDITR